MLQTECDKQAERILAEFGKKRDLREKASRVREALYRGSSAAGSNSDKIAAKDLDHVLSEIILLQARTEMYYKFTKKRVMVRERWLEKNTAI